MFIVEYLKLASMKIKIRQFAVGKFLKQSNRGPSEIHIFNFLSKQLVTQNITVRVFSKSTRSVEFKGCFRCRHHGDSL